MLSLNRAACEVLRGLPDGVVHACTDVTGFGLIGHASEMALASRCTARVDASRVPLLSGALELADVNLPGGGRTNAEHFASGLSIGSGIDSRLVALLHDPQTSGGLLAALDPSFAARAAEAFRAAGVAAWQVGTLAPAAGGTLIELE
jgi:selenide,water dikinase